MVRIWMGWDVTVLRGWVNSVTVAIEKRLGRGSDGKNNESGKNGESRSASGSGKDSDGIVMKCTEEVDSKECMHLEKGQGKGQGLTSLSSHEQTLTLVPPSPSTFYSPAAGEEIPPPPTLADFPSPYSIEDRVSKGRKLHRLELEKTPQGYNKDPHSQGGHLYHQSVESFSPGVYLPNDGMLSSSLSSPRSVFKACVEELTERQNTNQF